MSSFNEVRKLLQSSSRIAYEDHADVDRVMSVFQQLM
jgi:hypothetical protein